jgi:hypothetical protein
MLELPPWSGVFLATKEQKYYITKNWSKAVGGGIPLTDQAIPTDPAMQH